MKTWQVYRRRERYDYAPMSIPFPVDTHTDGLTLIEAINLTDRLNIELHNTQHKGACEGVTEAE